MNVKKRYSVENQIGRINIMNDIETMHPYIRITKNKTNKLYEEGQPCHECNSNKISIIETRQVSLERNLITSKIIRKDKNGEMEFWHYKCRKCGWISDCFQE
jgi:hypothetical protein